MGHISTGSSGQSDSTKHGLHLPLAHLSPQAVFTPSPAMIQNHGEKFTGVIHLLHMDMSPTPLPQQSDWPYIMPQI